jgi:diguanylate cyclase
VTEDDKDWRGKYRTTVAELTALESSQQQTTSTARLIIKRLCLAAQGRNAVLDRELQRLTETLQESFDPAALNDLLAPLSQAIAALDIDTAVTDSPQLAAEMPSLLEQIELIPELRKFATDLRNRTLAPLDLVDLLKQLVTLVSEQQVRLQRERLEFEDLLQQTTSRLHEIEGHLAKELTEQNATQANTADLSSFVGNELDQIKNGVQRSTDISQLRQELTVRLDTIAQRVQTYQERETARHQEYRERTERMRERIATLESESRNLHQNLKQEQQQAMIDILTGIPNRAAYDERIVQEMNRWQRFSQPTTLLTWDVDEFKTINDTYGHKAGDKVLRVIGQKLVRHVRDTDFVARYGGDEFVMLLIGTAAKDAKDVAERIRTEIASLGFHFHEQPVQITVSCGISSFATDDTGDRVFERADQALYQAKKTGRNCCAIG